MNICFRSPCGHIFSFIFGCYLGAELQDYSLYTQVYENLPELFLRCLQNFTLQTTGFENPSWLIYSQTLCFVPLNFRHGGCTVASYHDLDFSRNVSSFVRYIICEYFLRGFGLLIQKFFCQYLLINNVFNSDRVIY